MTQPQLALRDARVIAWILQLAVLGFVLVGLWIGAMRILADLSANNLAPGLDFLGNKAGFAIGEGPAFDGQVDSYGRAFVVGLVNTLRVALAGIVLATLLGFVVALGRLSGNPLVERLCAGYIELFRNTPLLVQLIFWYQGVILRLPPLKEGLALGRMPSVPNAEGLSALAFVSRRGVALPRPLQTDQAWLWGGSLLFACLVALAIYRWRGARQREMGVPARPLLWVLLAVLGTIAAASALLGLSAPLTFELPLQDRFKYASGMVLSPEFAALLIGLVVYSAAFIAEVVRSGIQAVDRGQREAATALGLSTGQTLRMVVVPQAMRVIIPPLTSQYLNLTKNSSLAIYIGFPDLFNVSLTIGNNTGQFVVLTAMIMAVYLGLSLLTSVIMNVYNRRIQLVER